MIQKRAKNQTRRILTRQPLEREVRRVLMIKPHRVRRKNKSLLSHLLLQMQRQRRKEERLINLLLAREMPRRHFFQNRQRQRVKSLAAASRQASPPKHLPVKRPRLQSMPKRLRQVQLLFFLQNQTKSIPVMVIVPSSRNQFVIR